MGVDCYNSLKLAGVIMEGEEQSQHPDQPAFDHVSRLIVGGRIAQIISVVAELGIPDLLQDSPRTGEEIAQAADAHIGAIQRLMRAVAALGLVSMGDDRYVLTPLGATLRSDLPERLDLHARYLGQEASWDAWGDLMHSIRTGEAAFSHALGVQPWEYGEQHPDFSRIFNAWMTVGSRRRQDAILAAYDFSRFHALIDIVGGHGQLLAAVLQRYPELRGVLFDQPHVVAGAGEILTELGVNERCSIVAGSFFDSGPPGGDAYMLKFILHDWNDDRALALLQTVARSMEPGTILLVIDRVLPAHGVPDLDAALMDLHMLVQFAGKERTETEFRSLYEGAGFRLTRVLPTDSDVGLVEGIRTDQS